jgi:hypothetical protein
MLNNCGKLPDKRFVPRVVGVKSTRTFEERRGGRPWNVIQSSFDNEPTQNAIKNPEDSERKDPFEN